MENDKSPKLEAREAADYGSAEWHSEQRRLMGSNRYPSLSEARASYSTSLEESNGLTTEQARKLVAEESEEEIEEDEDLDEVVRVAPDPNYGRSSQAAMMKGMKKRATTPTVGSDPASAKNLYGKNLKAAGAVKGAAKMGVEHVESIWTDAANTRGITGAGSMAGIVGDLSEAVDGKRSEEGAWVAEQRRLMGFDR